MTEEDARDAEDAKDAKDACGALLKKRPTPRKTFVSGVGKKGMGIK